MPELQVIYDAAEREYVSNHYRVRIKTAASIAVRNSLTVLGMTRPKDQRNVWETLKEQVDAMAGEREKNVLSTPGTVYYQPFAFWVESEKRSITFTLMFGLILRGGVRRGQLRGDFLFLIVKPEEYEDALRSIFHNRKAGVELVDSDESESHASPQN